MENQPHDPASMIADLQRLRAFDRVSHDRLMARVAALQQAGLLPQPNQRLLFSALPDLQLLLAGDAASPQNTEPLPTLNASAQARSIRERLQVALRHH
ncbi:MAG TPA: hypothetical protein VMB34_24975 [Acetobacteraceae bacterium]|nr:hypothetical protein [Acetobacteraceae bacterium]